MIRSAVQAAFAEPSMPAATLITRPRGTAFSRFEGGSWNE